MSCPRTSKFVDLYGTILSTISLCVLVMDRWFKLEKCLYSETLKVNRDKIDMNIPGNLIDRIKRGKVILFLGSGALFGAKLPDERPIPLGNGLRDIICERFLNKNFEDSDLAHVSAMAISQTSLFEVQDFIKDYFMGLEPAPFHFKIPNFKWRAIFTTNYDLLIETCYSQATEPVQTLCNILSQEDSLDETRVTTDKLLHVKLHGCITRTHDSSLPLVLTTDQYNESLDARKRLFNHLYELAYENTVVFVGHSLTDHNIRKVLLSLEKECPGGQRHYLIKPGVDEIESHFWGEKKITTLDITFEDFIGEIVRNISEEDRVLSLVRPLGEHPIQSVFSSHVSPSDELIDYLTNHVEWVTPDTSFAPAEPKDFFKGVDQGWFPISEGITIPRNLRRSISEYAIERPEAERETASDFYVVKAEAGAGKTILLRQLAWEIGKSSLGVVIWVRPGSVADSDFIEEMSIKSKERIYVFWDDAAVNAIELNRFLKKVRKRNLRVTVFTAERYSEWNTRCEDLDELVSGVFKLKYLAENEIDLLVSKLEDFSSLGPNLINKTHEERCNEFREIYGRQLLVALHEATMGEPFEDIIFHEYENIYPETAKRIYLTVCTLNRLKIPVRAGLISRIHDISFSRFQSEFYKPLEKVVIPKGRSDQDMHYSARHSEIAEIVFRRALAEVRDRYQEYINIVNKLNISFSSDLSSLRSLIRAKSLHELFPDYDDVSAIYDHALESNGRDPYILQQKANYERIRPNGSLDVALELFLEARELAPNDSSILHSLSVLWRDKSHQESDPRLRRKCRLESRSYLEQRVSKWGVDGHTSASFIELSIEALRDLLSDDASTQISVREAIRSVQQEISDNKRRFPSEGYIYALEAQFSELIDEHKNALLALEKSFEESDREPHLAIRLASKFEKNGENEKAEKIYITALERRRSDHKLNFHFAEFLRSRGDDNIELLLYYYRRAFTPGDSNYQAQFWYARYAFGYAAKDLRSEALAIFVNLRNARLSHEAKIKIRDYDIEGGDRKRFSGVITTKKVAFGFLRIDGSGDEIFIPAPSVEEDLWEAMLEGDRIVFSIGYSYNGPVACDVSYR